MKNYYEENIKFNTARFTSGFYATIILIGGELGLLINGDFNSKRILLAIFSGLFIIMGAITYRLNLQNSIKEDILKIKNYD